MNKQMKSILLVVLILLLIGTSYGSDKLTATTNDYYMYYGSDTPAGQTHHYAVVVDGNVYYMNDKIAGRLASYSNMMKKAYDYDLEKFADNLKPDMLSFGRNGLNYYYSLNEPADDEMFEFYNDVSFDFEYTGNQHVGYNRNAKVVTNIYYPNGGEITDTYY